MYNPSDHKPQNIPFGITDLPLNAKSLYYDKIKFLYRAFLSVSECQDYFADEFKDPTFDCIVNIGGTLQIDGTIDGGINDAYWFRDSVTLEKKVSNGYSAAQIDALFSALSDVAISGSYDDLLDKPDIPSLAPVQSVNGRTGAVFGLAEGDDLVAEVQRATAAELLKTDLTLFNSSIEGLTEDVLNANLQLSTSKVATAAQTVFVFDELIGKFPKLVLRGKNTNYTPSTVASDSDGTVLFDITTGSITMPDGLSAGEVLKVLYSGTGDVSTVPESLVTQTQLLQYTKIIDVFDASVNMIDKVAAGVSLGRSLNTTNGTLNVDANYNTTALITVVPGTAYTVKAARKIANYSSTNVFIDAPLGNITNQHDPTTFTPAAGVAKVRISVHIDDWVTAQLEPGTVSTAYNPFGNLLFKESKLPVSVSNLVANFPAIFSTQLAASDLYGALTLGNKITNGNFTNGTTGHTIATASNQFLPTYAVEDITPVVGISSALKLSNLRRSSDGLRSILRDLVTVVIPTEKYGGFMSLSYLYNGDDTNLTFTTNVEFYNAGGTNLGVSGSGTTSVEDVALGYKRLNRINITIPPTAVSVRYSPRIEAKTTATIDVVFPSYHTGLILDFVATKVTNTGFSTAKKLATSPDFTENSGTNDAGVIKVVYGATAGKKTTWFGDSITYGEGLTGFRVPVENKLGLVGKNRGIGGSRATAGTQTAWVTMDGDYIGRPDAGDTIPAGTEGVDFKTINTSSSHDDRIGTIPLDSQLIPYAFGTNDDFTGNVLGTISDTVDTTFYGAVQISLNKLYARCPTAEIVILVPIYRADETTTHPNFYLKRLALKEIGAKYSYKVIDVGGECGINKNNQVTYKLSGDGIHPNLAGYERMSRVIIRGLQYIFAS